MQARDPNDDEVTEAKVRGACLASGCTCKDLQIVSRRHAAFFAAMAERSGQTAQRVIAVEADWRIPLAPLTAEGSIVREESSHLDEPTETIHVPTCAHESEADR